MLSLSQSHRLDLRLEPAIRLIQDQGHYNKIGDLELYSLHRIQSRFKTIPIGDNLRNGFFLALIDQNQKYQKETDSKRFCITSDHLYNAIGELRKILISKLSTNKEILIDNQFKIIIKWFDENYNDLLYDTSGKIPWPIVCMLRKRLSLWIIKIKENPFDLDLEETILNTAKEQGFDTDRVHEAWKAIGGKIDDDAL